MTILPTSDDSGAVVLSMPPDEAVGLAMDLLASALTGADEIERLEALSLVLQGLTRLLRAARSQPTMH